MKALFPKTHRPASERLPVGMMKKHRASYFFLIILAGLPAAVGACAHSSVRESLYTIESRIKPTTLSVGEKASATLVIRLKPGGNFSEGSPMRVLLSTTNISLKKYSLARDDSRVEGDTASFEIPFVPINRGAASIIADMSFYVCTETFCKKEERQVEMSFKVK